MLANCNVQATLPAADLERARRFYADKLGLNPVEQTDAGLTYHTGQTTFVVYPSSFAGTAQHTLVSWATDNIESLVVELQANGVVFEAYDLPGMKTVNGIADVQGARVAWFRDSEGNILALTQRRRG
ncbi:MAG: VOC family protein [bacterium]|nr:VOC family protein [bacterium]